MPAPMPLVDAPFVAGLFVISLFAGTVGALLGLGGGVVIVPALTLVLGVDIRLAVGASIVSVIATSSGAAAIYVRDRITNLRLAMLLEIMTTLGALTGALLAGRMNERFLFDLFAVCLFWSAWVMFRHRGEDIPQGVVEHPWAAKLHLSSSYPDKSLGREIHYVVAGVPAGLGMMYVAGVVSGLLGIGSGALKVPAMDRTMRLPMKVSSATSNFMIGVTAAGSAWIYFARGEIAPLIAAPVALGVLCGSAIGTRLLMRMRGSSIRRWFILILLVIAIQMGPRGAGIRIR